MVRLECQNSQATELSLRVLFILSVILTQATWEFRMPLHFD